MECFGCVGTISTKGRLVQVVYLAGPFRSHSTPYSYWEQEQNVNRAAEVALKLWAMGVSVICPHLNTRPFQGALPDEVWLQGDLELINRDDILEIGRASCRER